MEIDISRRTTLRYGLLGASAALLAACGVGGGSSSAKEQALRKWVVGTWDVSYSMDGYDTETGTITVKDDGTWSSTAPHYLLKRGGTWSTNGEVLNVMSRTRDDGVTEEENNFTFTGVPEQVGDGTSATPTLQQYRDTIIKTLKVKGKTLTVDADFQTRGRSPHNFYGTATRQ